LQTYLSDIVLAHVIFKDSKSTTFHYVAQGDVMCLMSYNAGVIAGYAWVSP